MLELVLKEILELRELLEHKVFKAFKVSVTVKLKMGSQQPLDKQHLPQIMSLDL